MKRVFYVPGQNGAFVKVNITPILQNNSTSPSKFQITSGGFTAIAERNKQGNFCFNKAPNRFLHNLSMVLKRYYSDLIEDFKV